MLNDSNKINSAAATSSIPPKYNTSQPEIRELVMQENGTMVWPEDVGKTSKELIPYLEQLNAPLQIKQYPFFPKDMVTPTPEEKPVERLNKVGPIPALIKQFGVNQPEHKLVLRDGKWVSLQHNKYTLKS